MASEKLINQLQKYVCSLCQMMDSDVKLLWRFTPDNLGVIIKFPGTPEYFLNRGEENSTLSFALFKSGEENWTFSSPLFKKCGRKCWIVYYVFSSAFFKSGEENSTLAF